jgi:hypothetical protein
MKQLGNLALICAAKRNVLLQVSNGKITVHVGQGPDKKFLTADWNDDKAVSTIIHELNYGKYSENKTA